MGRERPPRFRGIGALQPAPLRGKLPYAPHPAPRGHARGRALTVCQRQRRGSPARFPGAAGGPVPRGRCALPRGPARRRRGEAWAEGAPSGPRGEPGGGAGRGQRGSGAGQSGPLGPAAAAGAAGAPRRENGRGPGQSCLGPGAAARGSLAAAPAGRVGASGPAGAEGWV